MEKSNNTCMTHNKISILSFSECIKLCEFTLTVLKLEFWFFFGQKIRQIEESSALLSYNVNKLSRAFSPILILLGDKKSVKLNVCKQTLTSFFFDWDICIFLGGLLNIHFRVLTALKIWRCHKNNADLP